MSLELFLFEASFRLVKKHFEVEKRCEKLLTKTVRKSDRRRAFFEALCFTVAQSFMELCVAASWALGIWLMHHGHYSRDHVYM